MRGFSIIILIAITLLFAFCAPAKRDTELIKDLLSVQKFQNSADSIIISEIKYDRKHVLKIYETAFRERDSEGNKRINLDSIIRQWLMDENEIENINKSLAETNQKWTKKDFAFSNIMVRNIATFHDKGFFESHIGKSQLVYTLSDPVYSKDGNSALLYFSAMYFPYSAPLEGSGVVLFKKVKGKWIKSTVLSDDAYY